MELIDVVNKSGEPIGYIKDRCSNLNEEEFLLVVHAWIKSSKGLFLVQQRAPSKETDPLLWSITSGFVISGESSIETVHRELKEELSLSIYSDEINYVTRLTPKEGYKHIVDLYMIERDITSEDIMLQSEEVEAIAYWSPQEIIDKADENIFYNFNMMYDDYFNHVFKED